MRRNLDYNPTNGIAHTFHWDEEGEGQARITVDQDVTGILELNKEAAKIQGKRVDPGGMQLIASLPLSVWADLRKKGIMGDAKAFKRWLNDPDNRFFKATEAHV